jgi:hypothetical protein
MEASKLARRRSAIRNSCSPICRARSAVVVSPIRSATWRSIA